MPSLNLDLAFFEHRKVIRLISLAGRGSDANLIRLWCYCGRHHPEDGLLTDYSPEEIESFAGWTGKTGVLLEALLKVKLLDRTDGGFAIHGWTEHAGHLAVYRERAKAMAKAKWDKWRREKEAPPPPLQGLNASSSALGSATSNAKAEQSNTEQSRANIPMAAALPVVPPPWFPATAEAARQHAEFVGVSAELSDTEWNRAVGRGYTDAKGNPIRSWRHFIKAIDSDRRSRKEENRNGNRTTGARPSVADERNRFIGGPEGDSPNIPFD